MDYSTLSVVGLPDTSMESRLKIVINALSARRGGGQTYLLNLFQHLDAVPGLEAIVLAPPSLALPDHPALKKAKLEWPTDNPLLRAAWEKIKLPALLKEVDAEILFCPGGLVNTRVPKGCKTVTMFRNMIPFDLAVRKKYPLGMMRVRNWLLERLMLSSMVEADLVIFISKFARDVIMARSKGRIKNGVTIPHGINDHFRLASERVLPRPGWLPQEEYLLYVSIFDVYKNQLEVVRGFHLMKSRRGSREKLILAGHHSSPCAARVLSEVRELGLEGEVILPGNIAYSDLPAVYSHAKINIFASTCENCPNILLEALGAGRPLLVSDCQPMPEFGDDAVAYFNPFSPEDFAEKLEDLLEDEAALTAYAGKAKAQAALYNWKSAADATWRALESLIQQDKELPCLPAKHY